MRHWLSPMLVLALLFGGAMANAPLLMRSRPQLPSLSQQLGQHLGVNGDHIAAIDNATRKLMSDGQRPMTVGFWFSLGHSSVVFAMVMLLAFGIRALAGALADEGSQLQQITSVWGTSVSGLFLILIGLINLAALLGILRVFRRMRSGDYDEA